MTEIDQSDFFPCAKCGQLTHIDDLDAKPEPRTGWLGLLTPVRAFWLWWQYTWYGRIGVSSWDDPEGNTNWERFECRKCYGPGFESGREARNGL